LGQRIAVIDTERGSASAYADRFQFDTLQLTSFAPERYLEGIQAASDAGYDVLIIDSLSHAWAGKDGILEFVDKVAARSRSNNSFGAWREATPVHNKLVDGILDAKCHVIVTMRSKTEYVQEKDERTGRTTVRKVGMQPVQRDGLEYEMDIVADLDWENRLIVSKTRCEALQGYVVKQAGAELAGIIREWLGSGDAPAPQASTAPSSSTRGAKGQAPLDGIGPTRAGGMHKALLSCGVERRQHEAFASEVVGRKIADLAELTDDEARLVWAEARARRSDESGDPAPEPADAPLSVDDFADPVPSDDEDQAAPAAADGLFQDEKPAGKGKRERKLTGPEAGRLHKALGAAGLPADDHYAFAAAVL